MMYIYTDEEENATEMKDSCSGSVIFVKLEIIVNILNRLTMCLITCLDLISSAWMGERENIKPFASFDRCSIFNRLDI